MRQVDRALVEARQWPILEPIEADGQENPIALSKPVCVAGARRRVNLPLNADQISRAHALFVVDGDGVYLRDLASLNGVTVNDMPVREAAVRQGDVVEIGPFSFRCADHFPAARAAGGPHAPAAELRLPDAPAPVPLAGRTLVIGSRESCDVRLSDPKISPAHAVIFERDGRRFIRDLRGATGVFVNGKRVGEVELQWEDSIRVGDTEMTYAAASHATSGHEESDALPLSDEADVVSLRAHDSMIGPTQPAEAAAPKEPVAQSRPEDSDIIPLLSDEENLEPAGAGHEAVSASATEPEKPAAPAPEPDDSSLIPLANDSEAGAVVAAPSQRELAEEPRRQPAFDLSEEPAFPPEELLADDRPAGAIPDAANDPDASGAFAAPNPGDLDSPDSDDIFNELLDDLDGGAKQAHPGRNSSRNGEPRKAAKKSRRKVR